MKAAQGKIYVFVMGVLAMMHIILPTFWSPIDLGLVPPTLARELPSDKPPSSSSPKAVLEAIRGGRHDGYVSIVLQFSGKVGFIEPENKGDHLHLVLCDVSTSLPEFRRYDALDSWVSIEASSGNTTVRIGLPKNHVKTHSFTMDNPPRMVVNLYDGGSQPAGEKVIPAPWLRSAEPDQSSPLKDNPGRASVVIKGMGIARKATDDKEGAGVLPEGAPNGEDESPDPGDRKADPAAGGVVTGGGGGMKSGEGGAGGAVRRYRVKITPKVSVRGEYDDNIFLYKNNKKGDFITTVSPGLLLYMDSGRNGLELDYTFGWVRYNDMSENDFVRHSGRLKFWQRFSRRLTLNISDSYLKSNDVFDQDLSPELRPQRIRHTARPYQRNDLDANLEYHFGPQSTLAAGYRHGYLDNQDPNLEDVVEHSPYAKMTYWVNNKDGFELGYEYRRFDYSLGEAYGRNRVDLDAHDVRLGYMHRFGRRSIVRTRYGFANRNFKGVPVSYHVHEGGIGFEHPFSRSLTLALDIGYFRPNGININPGLEYTGRLEKRYRRGRAFVSVTSGWDEGFMDVEPRAFTRYWGGDAGIEYEPVHNLQAYAGVDYRKNDYALEEQQDDDTVGGRCGVRYQFLRWLTADLGYTHRRRVSKDPNNEYGDNRVTLTITAAKPYPYHWDF